MFIIRNILDPNNPRNITVIEQVKAILKAQFYALAEEEINNIADKLDNYFKYKFQTRLIVVQNQHEAVLGFALMMYDPVLKFCYLDYIAASKKLSGKGIGGALYEKIVDEATKLGSTCVLMECLPDDPKLCPDPIIRKQNERRLAFYEHYNVRPIMGTLYETPIKEDDTNIPYLAIDSLGQQLPLGKTLKKYVRAILERKYGDICDSDYINKVVSSFPEGQISIRPLKYIKDEKILDTKSKESDKLILISNEGHEIHHVKERGYVESPVRIKVILKEMLKLNYVKKIPAKFFSDKHISAVHDADYVKFIKKASMNVQPGKAIYPYIFPIRNQHRKPVDLPLLSGYYCIDTFTPINSEAYKAARTAVDCALTGATELLGGGKLAYALVRPPGHHAEKKSFGGFCYFSNTAIAANYLSKYGKVAILDIDYHHGNGQQDIFYKRRDVLTISIHGHPKFAYPYFTGFADEIGEGEGYGYNINMPLPEHVTPDEYIKTLIKALHKIKEYDPSYLVIALGLDTAKADPTGTWALSAENYVAIGEQIGKLYLPTLVVQEGGYRTRTLGINARKFFTGLHSSIYDKNNKIKNVKYHSMSAKIILRDNKIRFIDLEPIYDLAKKSKIFTPEYIDLISKNSVQASLYGPKSGNYFMTLERSGIMLGYCNFNKIPLTDNNYIINMLVIDHKNYSEGLGAYLLEQCINSMSKYQAKNIYVELPSNDNFIPAIEFFKKFGFIQSIVQEDFYTKDLHKLTLIKHLHE